MDATWTLAVNRRHLADTTLVSTTLPEPNTGEALLRVDRVGVTANNVTYAVLGDGFRYWEFFPATSGGLNAGWGIVPLWGFAEVVESTVDSVAVGARVYGFLPSASHLVVRPGPVDRGGFRDISEHRAQLPTPYNVYTLAGGDSAFHNGQEDLLILFRPLFYTSFMLADYVTDNDYFVADALVFSSASSKTAYGTAFLDVAGDDRTLTAVRDRLGDRLVHHIAVGTTHQDPRLMTGPSFFFAPDQMRKRSRDWGRRELDERLGAAWRRFASVAQDWVDVVVGRGPEALRDAWLEVLAGQSFTANRSRGGAVTDLAHRPPGARMTIGRCRDTAIRCAPSISYRQYC